MNDAASAYGQPEIGTLLHSWTFFLFNRDIICHVYCTSHNGFDADEDDIVIVSIGADFCFESWVHKSCLLYTSDAADE